MAIDKKININENQVTFKRDVGHKHDGLTSSLIDYTKYSLFDFLPSVRASGGARLNFQVANERSLKTFIVDAVEERVLNPQGIRIQANTITANEIAVGTITANELVRDFIMVNNTMKSNNYTQGSAGWKISNTGEAEFNNVIVRGNVQTNAGSIGGITISSNAIYAGTGVWANTNTPFYANNNGFFSLEDKLYWNPTTNLLTITGTLNASTVTGSTISGTVLTSGTWDSSGSSIGLRIDSDGYITGSGSGVKIRNFGTNGTDGATGWALFGDVILGPKVQSSLYFENDTSYLQIGSAGFIVKGDVYLKSRVSTATRFPVAVRDSDDELVVSASISSIRYKENIENLDINYKTLLKIEPVSFHYKKEILTEGDPSNKQYGFIAEQVDSLGLQDLVEYDKFNRPESIKYDNIPIYLLKVCQEQDKIIDSLISKISTLESRMQNLEGV
jgi:hypothetical protein